MQYLAAYYWQSANRNSSSLMLQQVYHKRRKLPVLMACVCLNQTDKNNGKKMITRLTDWFYGKVLPLCAGKGEKGIAIIDKSLKSFLKKEETNLKGVQMSGVFCVGNFLCFWEQGEQNIRLLNLRMHDSQMKELQMEKSEEQRIVFQSGVMQPGVGILLGTHGFYAGIPANVLKDCLNIKELRDQGHVEKRLQELGELGEARGGVDISAVLLVTR